MTTCPQCGANAAQDDRFCRECGAPLEVAASGAGAREANAAPVQAEPAQRRGGRLGFWALGLLVVPAALVWLASFLPGRVEALLALPAMSLMSIGGLLGALLGLYALFAQRGPLNRLCGLGAVVAVAGLLLATGDMDRTKAQRFLVHQGIAAALPARMAVEDVHARTGRFPDSVSEAPLGPLSDEHAEFVDAVSIGPGGVVTVHFKAGLNGPFAGKTIVYRPGAGPNGVSWTCDEGTVPGELRPPVCRSPGG